jgi:Reverse transcriptase (RNA-dependent DNA polymerase)
MRTKDEVFTTYKSFESWATTQRHCDKIKVLRSDRGGEYLSKAFDEHLAAAGTARSLTTHDTPQLNGVAERLNRSLLERIRALQHTSAFPKSTWGEALRHATWLKNRTATRTLGNKTPYEELFGTPPDLSELRLWGCNTWVHDDNGTKLDARAREGRWLGFDVDARAHRIYWPSTGTVGVERNVYFATASPLEGEESRLPVGNSEQIAAPDAPSISIPSPIPIDPLSSPITPSPPPLRRSTRVRRPPRPIRELQASEGVAYSDTNAPHPAPNLQAFEALADDSEESGGVWTVEEGTPALLEDFDGMESVFATETADAEALEPRTLAEAKRRPDWPSWEKAIEEELATLKAAGTWRLENAPPGANVIGSKWVLKAKKDAAGNVVRYKARLVAQGFSQIGGVDYDDTYAPVAKLASTRAVIAMANRLRMEMHQIDIKGAYLNGELNDNEVLYMQHPPGYKSPDAGTRVLRLVKTLYGLKQSGRRWYQKLSSVFDSLGFKQCAVDQAVYFRAIGTKGDLTVVVVHVDDCSIVATTIRLVEELKAGLRAHFEVTDLGELHWMLGIEVKRDRPGRVVHLSQRAYIDAILRRHQLADLKPLSTPMDHQVRLSTEQKPASAAECAMMRDVPYREAVGALNWAALATRPDIAFAVATVARFAQDPGPAHWEAVKRIFRYLSGTRDLWLTYGEESTPLEGYADADGSMAEDRRAVSGYAFLIDGGAVSWSSKRQEIVSLSTTESEYVAATHGGKEALWLRSLISEVFGTLTSPTTLFSDNQAAIALTRDHQYHPRTKHIDVRYHWIRWVVEKGSIRLVYCPTDDMVADVLTKALPSAKVKHFAASLGLRAK